MMPVTYNSISKHILNAIFTCVFLELFLGGSGRLIEFTSFLTLRMCLYGVYVTVTGICIFLKREINSFILVIFCYFLIACTIAVIVGLMNGARTADVFEDVKPLLNTFLILYLYYSINSIGTIKYLFKLIKMSAVLLVILHLVLYGIFLVNNNLILLYSALSQGADDINKTMFFFKGESGFVNYTGDVYLCIGFIVWEKYHKNGSLKYLILILIGIAIFLTGTRGLILALGLVYFVEWTILKPTYKSITATIAGGILIFLVFLNLKGSIGDKEASDLVRYNTFNQVIDRINPLSALIGHGFGNGVPERPVHMEISYLEVFHKQGMIGLFYYITIIIISYLFYRKCDTNHATGLYMFILFVYFLTFTNPYINHPLGITIIYIGLVSIIKISKFEKYQNIEFVN